MRERKVARRPYHKPPFSGKPGTESSRTWHLNSDPVTRAPKDVNILMGRICECDVSGCGVEQCDCIKGVEMRKDLELPEDIVGLGREGVLVIVLLL